ncbi:MAG TPA: helix-turn-helix transcriptional regulator [Candidatus Melainabacteria bacterium]|nr:helix-turn-helix transcriptional regulator [Candidatus Melainabacteria bacterium]HMP53790.1 helix-turn-helix transcriptional regulator [Candidatus Melainabacteria bacterium]
MAKVNRLIESPPFAVEKSIKQLGSNLRIARVRRNLSIASVAERIGTGPRAVMDAEKGKLSTGIAVFAALLWLYDQLDQLDEVALPERDAEGIVFESASRRIRAGRVNGTRELDNDF